MLRERIATLEGQVVGLTADLSFVKDTVRGLQARDCPITVREICRTLETHLCLLAHETIVKKPEVVLNTKGTICR